jgi:hypothetical protein
MAKKKCIVQIDGSNFYFKLKNLHLQNLLKFDFSSFAGMLTGDGELVFIMLEQLELMERRKHKDYLVSKESYYHILKSIM